MDTRHIFCKWKTIILTYSNNIKWIYTNTSFWFNYEEYSVSTQLINFPNIYHIRRNSSAGYGYLLEYWLFISFYALLFPQNNLPTCPDLVHKQHFHLQVFLSKLKFPSFQQLPPSPNDLTPPVSKVISMDYFKWLFIFFYYWNIYPLSFKSSPK